MISALTLFKLLLFLLGFILLYSFLQFFLTIHPPRYSDATTPADFGLYYEAVSFQSSDNLLIRGWLLSSDRAKGIVIVGHGYPFDKGNILPVVIFLHPDYTVLLYDHRYFGESEGSITTVGVREVQDVVAAVRFVQGRFGKEEPIALYGFSLSAAAMLMAQADVEAIIADSSYAGLHKMTQHIYFYFGPFKWPFVVVTELFAKLFLGIDAAKQSPVKAVQDSTTPILLIHGERDSQIPAEHARLLHAANVNTTLWLVPGADHGQAYALHKREYQQRVKTFLARHMRK